MIASVVLFFVGLLLSAFFSGSETGLYRVSRTRLILDGLSGSQAARCIIWLLNHPEIFVATALVGNNLANYVTSLALVMGAVELFGSGTSTELIGPILMTPIVFVLGELLPKYLFFHAPYLLVTKIRGLFLAATALFLPVSLILGLLGRLLQIVTGQMPFQLRLQMARGELDQVLRHGHEAGILAAGQRAVAQRLFEVGNQNAISFGVPLDRLATVDQPIQIEEARTKARRKNHPVVLVREKDKIIGAALYADLCVAQPELTIKPVIRARTNERHLTVLLRMYDAGSNVAVLQNETGKVSGVVTRRQLLQPLIK